MVPFHSYYIHSYYIHEERRGGEGVGENDHMGWASHKEGGGPSFMGKGELNPLDTMKNHFMCLKYYQFWKVSVVITLQINRLHLSNVTFRMYP